MLDGVGGQRQAPAALPAGKTRYALYRRLGGLQAQSGRVRKIKPKTGFDPRTVYPVASRYTDWAIPVHLLTGFPTQRSQYPNLPTYHSRFLGWKLTVTFMTDGFDPTVTEANNRSTGCTENVRLQGKKKKVKAVCGYYSTAALRHIVLLPEWVPSFISRGAAHTKRRERPLLAKEGTVPGI